MPQIGTTTWQQDSYFAFARSNIYFKLRRSRAGYGTMRLSKDAITARQSG